MPRGYWILSQFFFPSFEINDLHLVITLSLENEKRFFDEFYGGFGRREILEIDHHFDLVELMQADEPANILAIGTRLAPETGRVSGEPLGQRRVFENFAPVEVGQRYFGRRHKIPGKAFYFEQIIASTASRSSLRGSRRMVPFETTRLRMPFSRAFSAVSITYSMKTMGSV